MNRTPIIVLLSCLLLASAGCEDDLPAELAREAANRQAAQNEVMAEVTRETAEATREIVAVHRDLQAERQQLSSGWNALESERQEIAAQRRTESALAVALKGTGVVAVALLALGVALLVLFGQRRAEGGDELIELVVREALAGGPAHSVFPPSQSEAHPNPRLNHQPEEDA